jgi:hypothetical protein
MALQVGGTTVINDSRQLQSIASLDSTTAATIGSSVGGGGWSRRTTGNFVNNTEILDITFPTTGGASKEYYVVFPKIVGVGLAGNTIGNTLNFKMFDGSYNLMSTGGDYRGYDNVNVSTTDATNRSYISILAGFNEHDPNYISGYIHVWNDPTSSSTRTHMDIKLSGKNNYNGNVGIWKGCFSMHEYEATPRMRLYTHISSWPTFSSNSASYEVWGLDV